MRVKNLPRNKLMVIFCFQIASCFGNITNSLACFQSSRLRLSDSDICNIDITRTNSQARQLKHEVEQEKG